MIIEHRCMQSQICLDPSWYLYLMVTQQYVRTLEEKLVIKENNIKGTLKQEK